jgi:hypothetical protein
MNRKNQQSGQVALVVLLIMIVILTIGLSWVSQSLTDIKISLNEKEALRAFSAAEAGIEEILRLPSPLAAGTYNVNVESGLTANVSVAAIGEGLVQTVDKGEAINIFLTGSTASSLTINWIDETKPDETDVAASLEVIVYNSAYTFSRYAFSPDSLGNDFTAVLTNPAGNFMRQTTVSVNPPGDVLVRIRPLYDKATVMVASNNSSLPAQQYGITSTVSGLGNKTSQIVVTRTIATVPTVFDYVLFSGGNISN